MELVTDMREEPLMRAWRVSVHWTKQVPDAPPNWRWHTLPCFDQEEEGSGHGQWTVVLDFEVPPQIQGNPSQAKARFLVSSAPHERFRPGAVFRISERFGPPAIVTIEDLEPVA
jgi:hypothetical protein